LWSNSTGKLGSIWLIWIRLCRSRKDVIWWIL
jgi:hypothetical protein